MIRKIISALCFLISLAMVAYGGYMFIDHRIEMAQSSKANESISELVVQKVPPKQTQPVQVSVSQTKPDQEIDSEQTEATETTEPKEVAPISVDFQELNRRYPDAIGWLYCEDTPINYPVMGSRDNLDYIYSLPDGTYNEAGSLFLDFRCEKDFLNGYSVVYGHNLKNDAMFGILEEYKKREFYEEHPVMYLLTADKAYRIDLMSGYVTWGTSEFYRIPMEEEDIDDMLLKAREGSVFQTIAEPKEDVPYLVLSTCDYTKDDGRLILMGAMTEIEKG